MRKLNQINNIILHKIGLDKVILSIIYEW